MTIQELLDITVAKKASDLHLVVGFPPVNRIDGALVNMDQTSILTKETIKELILSLLTPQQKDLFLTNKELDFSFDYGEKGRFRVNAYYEKGNMAAALRLLPSIIATIDQLQLPKIYHDFVKLKRGFVLVTGPTGHGKSSTLAAIIEEINQTRRENIITIEDPIEYLYKAKQSIISQRELQADTHSWNVALRSILREDPDVVLVGEMRDFETIAAAITIAETGHLVFATLHTNSASQTIDRIIDVFPAHQQNQIKLQLSNVLEAVLSQRLLPALGGGRIAATEILLGSSATRATIREGKTHLIDNIIQTSAAMGMMSLENSLAGWIKKGKLSLETALPWCIRPDDLLRLIKGS